MLILNFIKNDSFKGYFVNNYLNKNFNTMNFLILVFQHLKIQCELEIFL